MAVSAPAPARRRPRPARLTRREWLALAGAVATREADLADRARYGEPVGHEAAALGRALDKVRDAMASPPTGKAS